MRRTREWWARLTADERSELYWLERADRSSNGGDAYLPEGYSGCGRCDTPTSCGGLCRSCLQRLIDLIDKADEKEKP